MNEGANDSVFGREFCWLASGWHHPKAIAACNDYTAIEDG